MVTLGIASITREIIDIRSMNILAARYRHAVDRQPQLDAQVHDLRSRIASSNILFSDGSADSTSADLGESIKQIVDGAQGEVRSISSEPVTQEAGLQRVALKVDVILPEERLAPFLINLRSHRPRIFLNSLSIDGGAEGAAAGKLWIMIGASAFRLWQPNHG